MPLCLPTWKSGMIHSEFDDWHLLHFKSPGLRGHLTLLRRHARQAACLRLPVALLPSEEAVAASIRTLGVDQRTSRLAAEYLHRRQDLGKMSVFMLG